MCNKLDGEAVPIPTFSLLSIVIAVLVALSSIPKEVRLPLAVKLPVILIFPVPVISFEFKSKSPPICGVVSSTTFDIPP
jgi:hypothetical protein